MIAICGSLPPGAPVNLHARLIAAARERGAYTILDSSTPAALAAALSEGPDLVAPNLAEAALRSPATGPPREPEAMAELRSEAAAPARSG